MDKDENKADAISLDNIQGDNVISQVGGEKTNYSQTQPGETPEAKVAREKVDADNKAKIDLEATQKEEATKLATSLGGASIDKDGNVLDKDGKVFLSKADAEKKKAENVAVTLDNVTYKLDKDGNALRENGEIFKTKAELDTIATEQEIANLSVIGSIQKALGYEFKDDKGNPIVFEDTVEGINKYNELVLDKLRKEDQNDFLNTNPRLKDYAKAVFSGISDEEYFARKKKTNWKETKIDVKNVDQAKDVIIQNYLDQGFTVEKANKFYDFHKEREEVEGEATNAIKELQNRQVKGEEDFNRVQEQRRNQQIEDDNKYWNNIENQIVKEGKLKDIQIPQADREGFLKYVAFDADGKGNSQEILDRSKEDVETSLLHAFFRYKKYNLSNLIKVEAQTLKAKTLKEQLELAAKLARNLGNGSGQDGERYEKTNDVSNLTIGNITNRN